MRLGDRLLARFKDLSIRRKLLFIMTLLSWGTLFLATVAFTIVEYLQEQDSLTEHIRTQAEIVAFNSRAALTFNDPDTARRVLSALKANNNVHSAALFTQDGRLFAKFTRLASEDDRALSAPGRPLEESVRFDHDELTLRQPIRLDDELIGGILINAHLEEFGKQMVLHTFVILIILLVTFSLTFYLALRLQNLITVPIESLRTAASAIGQGDFDTPIRIHSRDEIGQLALSFQRMSQDLAHERASLQRATRAKSEFLANMSHEIRTPMNAIIGLTELTLQHPMEERPRSFLKKIAGSSRALLRILNDILDFSKIEAGKLDLELRPFTLSEVIGHMNDLFAEQAAEKKIQLELNNPSAYPGPLLGDSLRLEQVLLNLIGNAIKFTDAGGGRVTLTVTTLQVTPKRVELEFAICDTGVGIDPTLRDHLFDAFTQADSSTTRRYGGSGLGLAICKRLVDLMQGRIEVESQLGQGSTFRFTARFTPVTGVHEQRVGEEAHVSRLDPREVIVRIAGARILLAEDNAINQLVAVEMLSALHLEVQVVENGWQAVERAKEEHFDLVLMDLQMPVMDGYAATRALRVEPGLHDLPIVAMTAHAMSGDREFSLAQGMNDHLTKPIDKDALHAALMRWIRPRLGIGADRAPVAPDKTANAALMQPERIPGIDLTEVMERLDGNQSLLRHLLDNFAARYATADRELSSMLASRTPEGVTEAARYIHTIKGMAGNLGARALHGAALALERAIQENRPELFSAPLAAFERIHGELLDAIVALPAESVVEETTFDSGPVDRTILLPPLRALARAIRNNDFEASDRLREVEALSRCAENAALFTRIAQALDGFEFERALEMLNQIAASVGIGDEELK
ncbi:MAG: ATP-binding protein [Magnetococcus sp. YQC-9]